MYVYITNDHICTGNPDNKLTADGRVALGQLAEVHSDFYQNGKKKNLFHVLVHLDENKFLKPDFEFNKDNLEYVVVIYNIYIQIYLYTFCYISYLY